MKVVRAMASAVAVAGLASGCGGGGSAATGDGGTAIEQAYETCDAETTEALEGSEFAIEVADYAQVEDQGKTLFLQTAASDDLDGSIMSLALSACFLDELGAPASLVRKIDQTTALQGQLTDEWETFEATWTYHPDNGLDLIVEER